VDDSAHVGGRQHRRFAVVDGGEHAGLDEADELLSVARDADRDEQAWRDGAPEQAELPVARQVSAFADRARGTAAPALSASSRALGMSSGGSSEPRQTTTSAASRSRAGTSWRSTSRARGSGASSSSIRSTIASTSRGSRGSNIRARTVASCGVVEPMITETMFPP
jgi:hypothetical protein